MNSITTKLQSKLVTLVAAATIACLTGVALGASGSQGPSDASPHPLGDVSRQPQQGITVPVCGRESFAFGDSQGGAQQGSQMAEDVFKNIQVLKGIPVDEFMGTMGIMSAALSFCCSECHTGAGTETVRWEADTPRKRTARTMVEMVNAINRNNFAGRQAVTCWTCHRGRDRPVDTPHLDTVYGPAILESDVLLPTAAGGEPSADEILDKYLAALGGVERLAKVTSFLAKGTAQNFGGFGKGSQVEIVARAPDQRATRIQLPDVTLGSSIRTYDGRSGWMATPLTAVREYPLSGSELEGARLDAQLSFPAQIKQVLNWRVTDSDVVNDRDVYVLQGGNPRGLVATLYFDKETGLLQRMIRYSTSPIGRVPTQVDYGDYREVGGIKMPFQWTFAWLDGRDSFALNDVQLNVPIDAAKFGRPGVGQ
jgi:hypothetical protein